MPIKLEDLRRSPGLTEGLGFHFDFYNRLVEMGRARSRWRSPDFFAGKQLSTQDWTFYFYQRFARKKPKNVLIFGSNQNGLKVETTTTTTTKSKKSIQTKKPTKRNACSTTTSHQPPNGLFFRCLGHDFGGCLFSLFGYKGAWWSFCSHVCLRSSRGIVGRVVDLGRRFLGGWLISGWMEPEPGTFGLIPAEPLLRQGCLQT